MQLVVEEKCYKENISIEEIEEVTYFFDRLRRKHFLLYCTVLCFKAKSFLSEFLDILKNIAFS